MPAAAAPMIAPVLPEKGERLADVAALELRSARVSLARPVELPLEPVALLALLALLRLLVVLLLSLSALALLARLRLVDLLGASVAMVPLLVSETVRRQQPLAARDVPPPERSELTAAAVD
jgi:hypothetical protein